LNPLRLHSLGLLGGSWLQPLLVLTPRFVKFTAQLDF